MGELPALCFRYHSMSCLPEIEDPACLEKSERTIEGLVIDIGADRSIMRGKDICVDSLCFLRCQSLGAQGSAGNTPR